MLTKNWAKQIRALQQKKFRKEFNAFVVEGEKSVAELLSSDWPIQALFASAQFLTEHQSLLARANIDLIEQASAEELAKVGNFTSNNAALAVVQMPTWPALSVNPQSLYIALDDVNDPGNLGTIIRIADWYGISDIICSPNTVDCFNNKVVSAAKGSLLRVRLHYTPLAEWLASQPLPVFGAFLGGSSVHQLKVPRGAVLVLGMKPTASVPQLRQPSVKKSLSQALAMPSH